MKTKRDDLLLAVRAGDNLVLVEFSAIPSLRKFRVVALMIHPIPPGYIDGLSKSAICFGVMIAKFGANRCSKSAAGVISVVSLRIRVSQVTRYLALA